MIISIIRLRFVFILFLMSFSSASIADYIVQGVRVSCTKDSYTVSGYNLENQQPNGQVINKGQGESVYFGSQGNIVNCLIGERKLKAEFFTEEPQLNGECGGEPGSRVSFFVDDSQLLNVRLFNNSCFESLDKIEFSQIGSKGYVLKVCGHNWQKKGCFVLKETEFKFLIESTSTFPFSDLVGNKTLKMMPIEGKE